MASCECCIEIERGMRIVEGEGVVLLNEEMIGSYL